MKKLKLAFILLSLTQAVFAKDAAKKYNCNFSSGMGYQKVDISFEKEFGNKFSTHVTIVNGVDKTVVEKFRSELKISKQDGSVYLDNKKNSHINPFADASTLTFDGIKNVFGFDQLTKDIALSFYTISGPVGNRASWTTKLTCKLESPLAPSEMNSDKIYNGSRNEIKTLDADSSSRKKPTSTKDK